MRNRADKKLQTDGRTDRQADSYIPPQTEFWGGGIITIFRQVQVESIC